MASDSLPPNVRISEAVAREAVYTCEIALTGDAFNGDVVRTRTNGDLVFINLLAIRPEGVPANDYRGWIPAAIARLKDAQRQLDEILNKEEMPHVLLARKLNEKILIGDGIVVQVVEIGRNEIRLGITAPKDVPILREELQQKGVTSQET